jgi:hypothetical protein
VIKSELFHLKFFFKKKLYNIIFFKKMVKNFYIKNKTSFVHARNIYIDRVVFQERALPIKEKNGHKKACSSKDRNHFDVQISPNPS